MTMVTQTVFNCGEHNLPALEWRLDFEPRVRAMRKMENSRPLIEGAADKGAGTRFICPLKDETKRARLIPFEFSLDQAYIIEAGAGYFRFCMDGGQIVDGGVPYEIVNPYTEAQIADLKYTQSADTLIMTHGDVCQKMLSRSGHTDWTIEDYPFEGGPWMDMNKNDDYKLAPSAKTGASITITASGSGFAPFTAQSVGRFVRLQHGTTDVTVGWAVINGYTDSTHVTAEVKQDFGATTATEEWNLGSWSEETGYPFNVHWVGPALGFTGTKTEPRRYVQSAVDDIYDFAPTNEKGEVLDSSAFTKDLGGEKANAIRWGAWAQYLMFGTNTGEYRIVTPGQEPLTPRNQTPRQDLALGSANLDPVRIGPEVVMVQEQGRKVFALNYAFESDGLSENELSKMAEHLTASGIVELAFQRTPRPTLWAVCNDGRLVSMTYSKKDKVVGWTPRTLGGNYLGGNPFVESIACIPGDGRDDLYMIVRRTINGQTRRYIEKMEAEYQEGELQEDCFYVDCGLTYAGPAVSEVSGLDHLEGQEVDILADGAVHPRQTVLDGKVSLQLPSCKVHVGLNYRTVLSPMRVEIQSDKGSTAGKDRRNDFAVIYMWGSLGLKYGPSLAEADLKPVVFRRTTDNMDQAPDLFTGIKRINIQGGFDPFADLYLVHDQPLPFRLQRLDRHFEFKD